MANTWNDPQSNYLNKRHNSVPPVSAYAAFSAAVDRADVARQAEKLAYYKWNADKSDANWQAWETATATLRAAEAAQATAKETLDMAVRS
jgi:hypothetical protein